MPAQARRAAEPARARGAALGARREARRALASQAFVELTFVLRRALRRHLPEPARRGEGAGRKHLREVEDPEVREKLTPAVQPRLQAPELLQRVPRHLQPRQRRCSRRPPIEAITRGGVRTADGVEHPIDVLVLATGFKVFDPGNMPPF